VSFSFLQAKHLTRVWQTRDSIPGGKGFVIHRAHYKNAYCSLFLQNYRSGKQTNLKDLPVNLLLDEKAGKTAMC